MSISVHKSNKKTSSLLAVFFILIFQLSESQAALSQPTNIKLASEAWVNATQEDGTGIYWDIMRLVYEPLGIKVEYHTTDYANSIEQVMLGEMDAWVGSYLDERKDVIYPRWPLDADVVSALYKKSPDFKWQGEKSLAGKKVGWIEGYNYNQYIETSFYFKGFETREAAVKMLEKGKLDFLLDAQIEVQNELQEDYFDATKFEYSTLMKLNIYPAFANNERGLQLQRIYDQRFAELLESGEIKKLFDKWNWPTYPFTKFCNFATSAMINC